MTKRVTRRLGTTGVSRGKVKDMTWKSPRKERCGALLQCLEISSTC